MKPVRVARFRLQGIPSIVPAAMELQIAKTISFDVTKSSRMPPEKEMRTKNHTASIDYETFHHSQNNVKKHHSFKSKRGWLSKKFGKHITF